MPRVGLLRRSLIDGFKNADLRAFIMVVTGCRQHAQILELRYRRVDARSDFGIVHKDFLRRQALPHLFVRFVSIIVVHFARRLTVHLLLKGPPLVRVLVV